jgi:hypothetical protein
LIASQFQSFGINSSDGPICVLRRKSVTGFPFSHCPLKTAVTSETSLPQVYQRYNFRVFDRYVPCLFPMTMTNSA